MSRILLVRHGQASWGAEDYDVLSELGGRQARMLGAALAARGVVPDLVLHGAMQRQRETARLLAEGAGWVDAREEDRGWDEMDHLAVLDAAPQQFPEGGPDREQFQAWFTAATDRWVGGDHDDDYTETFGAFLARVDAALDRVAERLGRGRTAVVVTSGGPISAVGCALLGGGAAQYTRIAPVVLNASVTRVVTGRRGRTLVSLNEHADLEAEPGLLTYR